MKITTEIIKAIPQGVKMTFPCDNKKAIHSARGLVSYVQNIATDGRKFKCNANMETLELTIEAIQL